MYVVLLACPLTFFCFESGVSFVGGFTVYLHAAPVVSHSQPLWHRAHIMPKGVAVRDYSSRCIVSGTTLLKSRGVWFGMHLTANHVVGLYSYAAAKRVVVDHEGHTNYKHIDFIRTV